MENDTVVLAFWWGYYRKLGAVLGKQKVNLAPIERHISPKKYCCLGLFRLLTWRAILALC